MFFYGKKMINSVYPLKLFEHCHSITIPIYNKFIGEFNSYISWCENCTML